MRYEARDVSLATGPVVHIVVELDKRPDGSQFVSSIESVGRDDGVALNAADQAEVQAQILGGRTIDISERRELAAH